MFKFLKNRWAKRPPKGQTHAASAADRLDFVTAMFDHSHFPKAFFKKNGKVLKANHAFCILTGYSLEEVKGLKLSSLIDGESDTLEALSVFDGKTYESFDKKREIIRKDGVKLWVSFTSTKIRDPQTGEELVMAELQNIHERTKAEEQIRSSKRMLQIVLDHIPVRVYWKNKDHEYIGANEVFAKDAGFSHPRDIIGQTDKQCRWHARAEIIRQMDEEVIESQKASINKESKWTLEDGSTQWLLSNRVPLLDEDGNFYALLGTFQDITEKNQMELALKENSERLELALNAANLGLWDWNLQTNEVLYSDVWCKQIGLDPKTVRHEFKTWEDRVHPSDISRAYEQIKAHTEGRTPYYEIIHRMQHSNGSWKWILSRGKVTEFENGKPSRFTGIHQDITLQKQLEAEVELQRANAINSSRLAALGEMAGGIAHEVNNPLAIIQGFASKLFRESSEDTLNQEELRRISLKIQGTTERIAKIIRGLKSFSREASHDPFEVKSVDEIISETLEFCSQKLANDNIDLRLKNITKDLEVECRSVELSQVILNLLNNASDAIENLEDKWVSLEARDEGNRIQIRITDSGSGIEEDISERIMEPFFTTKDTGRGTGLGLSISQGIIDRHHGTLELDQNADHTSFVIRLPKKQTS